MDYKETHTWHYVKIMIIRNPVLQDYFNIGQKHLMLIMNLAKTRIPVRLTY